MTKYTLSVGTWTKIASAGSTVEVQGQYVFLTQSATVPTSFTDAETLYGSDDYRKYDAPLPLDLYASFSYSGPSSSTLTGSVEVLPIGATCGNGTVQDTAADTALGTPADQPPAGPTTSGSVIAKLGGIWTALLGTLKVQVQNTSVAVSGTFWQATQPVSALDGGLLTLGTTTDAATASGANTTAIGALRAIRDKLFGSVAVTGTFYQATQPVSLVGSTGADFSANRPALPVVGASFAASGPYAGYVLVATLPANPLRANVDVENISGAQIAVVRDDGTAPSGSAPTNASVFALAGGPSAGAQGGSWSSQSFKGRLQVYAPSSTAIVTAMQD